MVGGKLSNPSVDARHRAEKTSEQRGSEMTQYVILLPGDETGWQNATPDQRAAMYDRHNRFMALLEQRGHRMIGGAELTHSSQAKVVRGELDAVTVTDGPYAETVEQLTGFYGVESDDLQDLLKICGLLAGEHGVEVRAAVPGPGESPAPTESHRAAAGVA
jgi:hypothetical protein